MRAVVRALAAPKAGNSPDEYEDAYYPAASPEATLAGPAARLAVADGASEASFSGLWARLLVGAYARGLDTVDDLRESLPDLSRVWLARVAGRPMPWYAEEKLQLGAFAALAGLSLVDSPDGPGDGGTWRALAVGDSCLFQVRGDDLLASVPLDDSSQFGRRPILVASRPDRNGAVWERAAALYGTWRLGDRFFLMTDALACWFLREREAGGMPWRELGALAGGADAQPAFEEWLAKRRASGSARNDDATLLFVELVGDSPSAASDEDEAPCPGR